MVTQSAARAIPHDRLGDSAVTMPTPCRVAVATRTPGNCLRSYSDAARACNCWLAATCATGSKRQSLSAATRTGRNTRGLNRSTNFRLRLALGTLARARHAAAIGAKQCVPTRRRNRTDTVRTLAPTSAIVLHRQPLEPCALTGLRLIRINQRQLAGRAG